MRCRGERVERSFAHVYDTGGMRRTHLRGHANILKRLLIHAGGFNLGLIMRQVIGLGTPRGLQGRLAAVIAALWTLLGSAQRSFLGIRTSVRTLRGWYSSATTIVVDVNSSAATTCTTGC